MGEFMKKTCIFILLLVTLNLFSQMVEEEWVNFYSGYLARGSEILVTDSYEDFIYTAERDGNSISTMKVNDQGEAVWTGTYGFTGTCYANPSEIKIDQDNNVYVSGFCDNWNLDVTEFIVIKYDQDGNELWASVIDYVDYIPNSNVRLDIDQQQNVYIASRYATGTTNSDYLIVKFDINGQELWNVTHDGIYNDDVPSDILVDASGNVFVVGLSEMSNDDYDILLVKYNSSGILEWEERYNAHCQYNYFYPRMILDESENICLIGMQTTEDQDDYDFAIMKYDQEGEMLWSQSFNGAYQNSWDSPKDLIIDEDGNIFILGNIQNEYSYTDMTILKYSSDGDLIWQEIYSSEYWATNNYAAAITLDIYENIYITGMIEYCFNTIKYTPEGELLWEIVWDEPDGRYDAYVRDILVQSSGDVYILGYNNYTGITLIRYTQPGFTDVGNNIIPQVQATLSNYPNPFNPSTTISFQTTNSYENVQIEIYNLKGQKVREFDVIMSGVEGESNSVTWNGTDKNSQPVSSGIYFYQLKVDGKPIAKNKCLMLK